LQLGPYAGAATDHTRIPYGRGICGQVALSGAAFVVPDVWAEDNYLACSLETKAEIVLPIFKEGKLIAQLDIDSHYANPFTDDDRAFLENLCTELGPRL
jgi:GAF domain-containing protein